MTELKPELLAAVINHLDVDAGFVVYTRPNVPNTIIVPHIADNLTEWHFTAATGSTWQGALRNPDGTYAGQTLRTNVPSMSVDAGKIAIGIQAALNGEDTND